jgi:hypothetical protein
MPWQCAFDFSTRPAARFVYMIESKQSDAIGASAKWLKDVWPIL